MSVTIFPHGNSRDGIQLDGAASALSAGVSIQLAPMSASPRSARAERHLEAVYRDHRGLAGLLWLAYDGLTLGERPHPVQQAADDTS